jgi:hypothetical protein
MPIVFLLLGMTPITMRTLYNYTLEICDTADHPRYLGTLSLTMAAPLVFSPITGGLTDIVGFERVLASGAVVILIGGLLTLRLNEPRHAPQPAPDPLDHVTEE